MSKIFNIGILAHVDAGKTTITENLLYLGGAIRNIGSVDKGSTVTDSLEIERERGISVKAACTSFYWKSNQINIIDTPGHVDFSSETERTLKVLDCAVLVLSAVEGIQSQTYSIWQALQILKIPTLIFINKLDRQGSDYEKIIEDIESELQTKPILLQFVQNEENENVSIKDILKNIEAEEASLFYNSNMEKLADVSEKILDLYLDEKQISHQLYKDEIKKLCHEHKLAPVLLGVAKNSIGIEELLNSIVEYLPSSSMEINNPLSALVFKIEHDKVHGRMAYIRVFEGKLKVKETIYNCTQEIQQKPAQIKKKLASKTENLQELNAGDIGLVSGLADIKIGDILGAENTRARVTNMQIPLLTVQALPANEAQFAQLAEALQMLNSEDPTLDFQWHREEKELHIKIMGTVQQEILQLTLLKRFGVEAIFQNPTVIYKETPLQKAIGYVEYTMPKPCWAVLKFIIEPGETGSGIQYESQIGVNNILRKYQNEVEQTIPRALKQGIQGWEVTDIKITLIDGEDHEMHSRPGDFILATPIGIMKGLKNSGTKILEPILSYEIQAEEIYLGKIAGELTNARAILGNPEFVGETFKLTGTIPASSSMDFPIKFSSITSGKGKLRFSFNGYEECNEQKGKSRPYKGVNPLDTSKWILHARGAYKADERSF